MEKLKLTRTAFEKLPFMQSGQKVYRSGSIRLAARSGHAEQDVCISVDANGTSRRVALGGYPVMLPPNRASRIREVPHTKRPVIEHLAETRASVHTIKRPREMH